MSSFKFELNSDGVRELLHDGGVVGVCQQHASAVLSRCGEGYEISARNYPDRAGYAVRAATSEAVRDNLKHNTLLKGMGG